MKKMVLILTALVLCTSLAFALGGAERAEQPTRPIEWKYSVVFPAVGTQAEGAMELGRLLEEYSDGRLEFKFYPSSQLGDKMASLEGLRAGTIEMTECAASDLSNFSPIWSVFSLPYLFDSGAEAVRVLNSPEVARILHEDAERNGFKIIAWCNYGERSVLNSRRPVYTPEDLSGLKIRVMQDPVLADAINAMGASGTPMAWSEVYTALQQRVIDGLENSPPVITANNMHEVAQFYSLTEQFIIPDPILVSKRIFDDLPADLQEAILAAGKASEEFWNNELWPAAFEKQFEVMRASGVQINEVDKDAFRASVQPMVDEFLRNADPRSRELYEAIIAAR
ncbi:MAG: TRAP transporter substrate-binding protein [Spirochaetaceae bacterium]|nr:MAG: TRAP transporter substrate-binding protein [Spirochaetaceae bacterium]